MLVPAVTSDYPYRSCGTSEFSVSAAMHVFVMSNLSEYGCGGNSINIRNWKLLQVAK